MSRAGVREGAALAIGAANVSADDGDCAVVVAVVLGGRSRNSVKSCVSGARVATGGAGGTGLGASMISAGAGLGGTVRAGDTGAKLIGGSTGATGAGGVTGTTGTTGVTAIGAGRGGTGMTGAGTTGGAGGATRAAGAGGAGGVTRAAGIAGGGAITVGGETGSSITAMERERNVSSATGAATNSESSASASSSATCASVADVNAWRGSSCSARAIQLWSAGGSG